MSSLKTINSDDMIVILLNTLNCYTFSPKLEKDITFLLDLPFEIPKDTVEFTKTSAIYISKIKEAVNSGRSIIFTHNTPLSCEILKHLRDKKTKPNAAGWLFLSFFHDDESLLKADINLEADARINWKLVDILSLTEYHFIKKFEIPFRFELTPEYMRELVWEIYS
jgi:hypothetical protein